MKLYQGIALCEKNVHKCKHLSRLGWDFKDGALLKYVTDIGQQYCWFQDKGKAWFS